MQKELKIINPATEEILKVVPCDSEASIQEKFKKAKAAQKIWSKKSLIERLECLRKFSIFLDEKKDMLSRTLSLEVGKPLQQSLNELKGASARIHYFLENSEKYLKEEMVFEALGRIEKTVYEPLGVVVNVSAWNYPYLVGVNVFVPALIAGNAVLYKPSEYATLTGLHIAEMLYESGVPQDVFSCVIGDGTQGGYLTSLPIDGVFFTGSVGTGKRIHQNLAGRLLVCGFELGGKDPVYVCEDVDLKKTVPAVSDGVFYNNGQSCCSVERLYVAASIYDDFVKIIVEEVKTYKMGDPLVSGVYLGPLTRAAQRQVLSLQVEDALKKSATLLHGGKNVSGLGYYFEATVLTDVNHTMSVMREESFGPIIGIQKVFSDEQAIELMNDTNYGLTAGVYSKDQSRAEKILQAINAGSVYWNCCDRVSPYLPWSGRQDSGLGSTLSHIGIRTFVRPKACHWISAI